MTSSFPDRKHQGGEMQQADYVIRTMTRSELDICIEWAAQEGWNPGLHDAEAFYRADPQGYLIGVLDGEPIATLSAVRYGPDFGFVGLYLVRPDCRGQGYGLAIWQAAMQRLQGRLIGLDGVVAQQANYRRSGFTLACNNVRYQTVAHSEVVTRPWDVVDVRIVPQHELFAYDRRCFGYQREAFLAYWMKQPGSHAMAIRANGALRGYGVMRPCRQGYKIGPLFADELDDARQLYAALVQAVPEGSVIQLDVPANHLQAVSLAQTLQMQPVFETARMYTGSAPPLDTGRIFGITTFELG